MLRKKIKKSILSVLLILSTFILFAGETAWAAPVKMSNGQLFDAEFYANANPDVAAVYGNDASKLYQHYLSCGKKEGRLPYVGALDSIVDTAQNIADWKTTKAGNCTRTDESGVMNLTVPAGNCIWVSRTFKVKPNTDYRIGADIRFAQPITPATGVDVSHAGLSYLTKKGNGTITNSFHYYSDTAWNRTYYSFNSENNTVVTVYFCVENMGTQNTVSIKNIVLDEFYMDNQWDVLAVIYRNADIQSEGFKKSFTDGQIASICQMLTEVPESLYYRSGERMSVRTLQTVICDTPITQATGTGRKGSLSMGPGGDINIDSYLEGHDYNLVIVFVPLYGYATEWLGLGGNTYSYSGKEIDRVLLNDSLFNNKNGVTTIDGRNYNTIGQPIYHEILHCVEANSRKNGWDGFATLHSVAEGNDHHGYAHYANGQAMTGVAWEAELMRWQTDLMQDKIQDGCRGFLPESFLVSHIR